MQKDYIYIFGDGDKIRDKIEGYLFEHDLAALERFSQSLTIAINKIKEDAALGMDAQVVMAGGDDMSSTR